MGTKGKGLQPSQVKAKVVLIDYIPRWQDENADCLLCPKEKTLGGMADAIDHYKHVHIYISTYYCKNINILIVQMFRQLIIIFI